MSDAAAPATPAAPPNGAPPAAPQKPAATKPPVESKPPEVEVDDSEEYVVDGKPVRLSKAQRQLHFQKALAADKRMKEAADIRNKVEEWEKLLETDFEAALAKRGKDPEKLLADHLAKKAKEQLLTPEQREAQKLQRERDEYKAKVEEAERREKEAKQAEIDQRMFAEVEKELTAAADKHGLDSAPEVLVALCDIWEDFASHGLQIKADQIVQEYLRQEREHIETRDKKLLTKLEGKKLLSYLGDATLAKIKTAMSEADAASLKEIPPPQARPRVPVKAHTREVKGYLRESDFDKKFLK